MALNTHLIILGTHQVLNSRLLIIPTMVWIGARSMTRITKSLTGLKVIGLSKTSSTLPSLMGSGIMVELSVTS